MVGGPALCDAEHQAAAKLSQPQHDRAKRVTQRMIGEPAAGSGVVQVDEVDPRGAPRGEVLPPEQRREARVAQPDADSQGVVRGTR